MLRSSCSLLAFASVAACALCVTSNAAAETAPTAKAPYSLPWVMRPAAAPRVVRSDTSFASFDGGNAMSTTIIAGTPVVERFGLYFRGALNRLDPDEGDANLAFANPLLISLWAPDIGAPWKLSLAGAVALPLGQGGGNDPNLRTLATVRSGIQSRLGMENAMFVPNYLTPILGADLAYVAHGFTVQGEATVLQLIRTRGEDVVGDETRTNFTSGLHVGYAIINELIVSAEAHYQRWLSTPAFVKADDRLREQATWVAGVRYTAKLGDVKLRPGLSFASAFDAPMSRADYRVIQLDIPVLF